VWGWGGHNRHEGKSVLIKSQPNETNLSILHLIRKLTFAKLIFYLAIKANISKLLSALRRGQNLTYCFSYSGSNKAWQ
jgi:hypothetical protein